MTDPVNDYINVRINGRAARVMMSYSHFKEVNVLGMLYFNTNDVGVHIYTSKEIFNLHFNQEYEMNQSTITHDLRREEVEKVEVKRYVHEVKSALSVSYLLIPILIGLYFLRKHSIN